MSKAKTLATAMNQKTAMGQPVCIEPTSCDAAAPKAIWVKPDQPAAAPVLDLIFPDCSWSLLNRILCNRHPPNDKLLEMRLSLFAGIGNMGLYPCGCRSVCPYALSTRSV
jgi:hypothetical protein